MKTLYQLLPQEFEDYVKTLSGSDKNKARAQLSFEKLVRICHYELSPDYAYTRANEKVTLVCNEGHIFAVKPSGFKNGNGCPECSKANRIKTRDSFESLVTSRGYSYGESYKYTKSAVHVDLICPEGHAYTVMPKNFKVGDGCRKCSILKLVA